MGPTRRQAAISGASYAAVSAIAYLAGVAVASVVVGNHWWIAVPRSALDRQAFDVPVLITAAASVASAAIPGALLGRLALRLIGSPLRRFALIVLVAARGWRAVWDLRQRASPIDVHLPCLHGSHIPWGRAGRTIHHLGQERFMAAGETITLPSRKK